MYKKWFECFSPGWHHSVAGIIIPVAAPSARVVAVARNGRKPTFWRRSIGFARFEAYRLRIHSVHWSRESNRIVLTAEGSEASRARGFPLTATWVKCGQVLQKRPIITHTIFPVCSISFDFCNLIVRISCIISWRKWDIPMCNYGKQESTCHQLTRRTKSIQTTEESLELAACRIQPKSQAVSGFLAIYPWTH